MAKKSSKTSKESKPVTESLDERIERNASMEGFEQEGKIAKEISSYANIEQKNSSRIGAIDTNSFRTNFKVTINGKDYAETDFQFNINLNNDYGWLARTLHLNNFLNNKFNTTDINAINVQSKLFTGVVPKNEVIHAVVQMYKMKRAGDNVRARTFVVAKENDVSKELELLLKHHVHVYTEEELGQEYNVIKRVGTNSVRMNRYVKEDDAYSWKKNVKFNLGDFVILDEGIIFKGPKIANIIYVNSLNNEYSKVMDSLNAVKSMNTEYYCFATPNGDQIVGEAKRFIERANVKEVSYDKLYNIFQNGKFYKSFQKLKGNVFGFAEEEIGRAKRELYDTLWEEVGTIPLLKQEKVEHAITDFLVGKSRIRHN